MEASKDYRSPPPLTFRLNYYLNAPIYPPKMFQYFFRRQYILLANLVFVLAIWISTIVYLMLEHFYWDGLEYAVRMLVKVSCGLLLLPVSKHTIWGFVFNKFSFDVSIAYHRYIGFWSLTFIAAHSIIWIYRIAFTNKYGPHDELIKSSFFVYADIALFCFFTIALTSFLRRRVWEIFRLFHYLWIFAVIFACMHAHHLIYFLIPGLLMLIFDYSCRLLTMSIGRAEIRYLPVRPALAKFVAEANAGTDMVLSLADTANFMEDLSVVEVKLLRGFWWGKRPGAYAFFNIPRVSLYQWHPFSIIWSREGSSKFYLIVRSNGGWCRGVSHVAMKKLFHSYSGKWKLRSTEKARMIKHVASDPGHVPSRYDSPGDALFSSIASNAPQPPPGSPRNSSPPHSPTSFTEDELVESASAHEQMFGAHSNLGPHRHHRHHRHHLQHIGSHHHIHHHHRGHHRGMMGMGRGRGILHPAHASRLQSGVFTSKDGAKEEDGEEDGETEVSEDLLRVDDIRDLEKYEKRTYENDSPVGLNNGDDIPLLYSGTGNKNGDQQQNLDEYPITPVTLFSYGTFAGLRRRRLARFDGILLIGGGCGIAPLLSVFQFCVDHNQGILEEAGYIRKRKKKNKKIKSDEEEEEGRNIFSAVQRMDKQKLQKISLVWGVANDIWASSLGGLLEMAEIEITQELSETVDLDVFIDRSDVHSAKVNAKQTRSNSPALIDVEGGDEEGREGNGMGVGEEGEGRDDGSGIPNIENVEEVIADSKMDSEDRAIFASCGIDGGNHSRSGPRRRPNLSSVDTSDSSQFHTKSGETVMSMIDMGVSTQGILDLPRHTRLHFGLPKLKPIFERYQQHRGTVLVMACGPETLKMIVRKTCYSMTNSNTLFVYESDNHLF